MALTSNPPGPALPRDRTRPCYNDDLGDDPWTQWGKIVIPDAPQNNAQSQQGTSTELPENSNNSPPIAKTSTSEESSSMYITSPPIAKTTSSSSSIYITKF